MLALLVEVRIHVTMTCKVVPYCHTAFSRVFHDIRASHDLSFEGFFGVVNVTFAISDSSNEISVPLVVISTQIVVLLLLCLLTPRAVLLTP